MHSRLVTLAKKVVARSTEVGARTLVDAALKGPASHGQYLQDCKARKCAAMVEGKGGAALQARVWTELCAELEKIEPGITAVVDA